MKINGLIKEDKITATHERKMIKELNLIYCLYNINWGGIEEHVKKYKTDILWHGVMHKLYGSLK